jgi:cell division protein FtsB
MYSKIKHYFHLVLDFITRFNDLRFTGQVVFVVIVLLISWSGVKAIQENYGLQKQISTLQQQNNIQQLKNKNMALQNQYYNSNQYLELSARQNFGLGAPGEKELLVPQNVALSYTVNLANTTPATAVATNHQPAYQRNFEDWVDFFLHRPSA